MSTDLAGRQVGPAGSANGTRCLGCDSHVSADFIRVFGTEDGDCWACLDCATLAALRDGAAAVPDHQARVQR